MNEQRNINHTFEELLFNYEKPFTVKEASKYLDVSVKHIYNLIYKKELTCFKPSGKRIYFKKSDLDKYLFRNEVKALEKN